MLTVNDRIQVPLKELQFSYSRSQGPGGQNVNKVNSKATLRWSVRDNRSLPEDVRERFVRRFSRRITKEGELVLTSQRFRDQGQNQRDCLEKLRVMLAAVAVPPKPRKKTKPTRASIRRRVEEKRVHSQKKQARRKPRGEE